MTGIFRKFYTEVLDETRRLGRHVAHDVESLGFPAEMASAIVDVDHKRYLTTLNQDNKGSCTGNAGVGLLCTEPFRQMNLTEADALSLYSDATKRDNITGTYPPNDTGSNGLAVMKVLKSRGLVSSYHHAFGLDHLLRALVLRPGILGMEWKTGCDVPDPDGTIHFEGGVRGGHEIELTTIDTANKRVGGWNSWGPWGLNDTGFFWISYADMDAVLAAYGDFIVGIPA